MEQELISRNRGKAPAIVGLACLALSVVCPLQAQSVSDAYQITGGVSDTHVEFHDYSIKPGEEKTLADMDGPGKITYFYITDDSLFHRTDTHWLCVSWVGLKGLLGRK